MLKLLIRLFIISGLSTLFAVACGGGITQSLSQQSTSSPAAMDAPPVVTNEQRADWARKAAGLYRNLEFTYSTSGYPAVGGFTAVALNENYEQFAAGEQDFSITVSDKNTVMKSVKLAADRHNRVIAHLWFDAGQWELAGVISKNPWPVDDFIAIPALVNDGLLQIVSVPVASSLDMEASGEFAEVFFVPAVNGRLYAVVSEGQGSLGASGMVQMLFTKTDPRQ